MKQGICLLIAFIILIISFLNILLAYLTSLLNSSKLITLKVLVWTWLYKACIANDIGFLIEKEKIKDCE